MTRIPGLAVTIVLLAGCNAGGPVVSESDLEEGVTEWFTQVSGAPGDVDCPGDLPGEVDTTMRCTVAAGSDELGVTVTVTAVDGTQITYDMEVDQQ